MKRTRVGCQLAGSAGIQSLRKNQVQTPLVRAQRLRSVLRKFVFQVDFQPVPVLCQFLGRAGAERGKIQDQLILMKPQGTKRAGCSDGRMLGANPKNPGIRGKCDGGIFGNAGG